jgi:hypothetical protein
MLVFRIFYGEYFCFFHFDLFFIDFRLKRSLCCAIRESNVDFYSVILNRRKLEKFFH